MPLLLLPNRTTVPASGSEALLSVIRIPVAEQWLMIAFEVIVKYIILTKAIFPLRSLVSARFGVVCELNIHPRADGMDVEN